MKTIGLIGGMSWESTAVYYRHINQQVRRLRGGLASADIALRSLDFTEVVALQKAGRWDLAGALLGLGERAVDDLPSGVDLVLLVAAEVLAWVLSVEQQLEAGLLLLVAEGVGRRVGRGSRTGRERHKQRRHRGDRRGPVGGTHFGSSFGYLE